MAKIQTIYKKLIMKIDPTIDNKTAEDIEKLVIFLNAAGDALNAKLDKYGEVEFDCPICGGNAYLFLEFTPDDPMRSAIVRGHCDQCSIQVSR